MSASEVLAKGLDKICAAAALGLGGSRKNAQLIADCNTCKELLNSPEALMSVQIITAEEKGGGEGVPVSHLPQTPGKEEGAPPAMAEGQAEAPPPAPEGAPEVAKRPQSEIVPADPSPAASPSAAGGTAPPSALADEDVDEEGDDEIITSQPSSPRGFANTKAVAKALGVLEAVVASRQPRMVEAAVLTVQDLVARGFVRGERVRGNPATLSARYVELVCGVFDLQDEAVELAILKVLLTAVTSATCQVHGAALLLAVKTCYNIFLCSRSETNQSTAKASLMQMLAVVFRRMEADSTAVPLTVVDVIGDASFEDSSPPVAQFVQGFVTKVIDDIQATMTPSGSMAALDDHHAGVFGVGRNDGEHHDDEGMLSDGDDDASFHLRDAAAALGEDAPPSPTTPAAPATPATGTRIGNLLRKDAFHVFRSLCRLSVRSSEGGADPFAARGKILALELLKMLLENSGPVFRNSDKLIAAIKQYLCLSLLKNCASPVPMAYQKACSIFVTLVRKFRSSMKAEIGVFFPMILLRPVEGGGAAGASASAAALAAFQQKAVAVHCLLALCQDPQLLVDLFINYDCDLESPNLFEQVVNALVRVAQLPSPLVEAGLVSAEKDHAVRLDALRCLVHIMSSMRAWTDGDAAGPEAAAGAALDARVASAGDLAAAGGGDAEEDPEAEAAGAGGGAGGSEARKAAKMRYQEGIKLFSKKPLKGLRLLQKEGFLGEGAEEVAAFLKATPGLDKAAIGDFLGEREEFSLKVMHSFVDSMTFETLTLDEALRIFLVAFRLPGEAQKIDRLMEKFAERYLKDNPGAFKSADAAYVLAYSIIMLNTDAHNPGVKKKMTKEQFLRSNRGINDGTDHDPEFMVALYDRITSNEIRMKDEALQASAGGKKAAASSASALFGLEAVLNLIPGRRAAPEDSMSEEAIRAHTEDLRERGLKGSAFVEALPGESVRPMLEVAWAPLLAAFSVPMETTDNSEVVGLCLDGIFHSICLSAVLCVGMIRDAYVSSLARFTMLHAPASMRPKHAMALRTLVRAAEAEGSSLQAAWEPVLRCLSRAEHLVQLSSGAITDARMFAAPSGGGAASPGGKGRGVFGRSLSGRKGSHDGDGAGAGTPAAAAEATPPPDVLALIDMADLSRVYAHSERLDSEGIVDFVRALSEVSKGELDSATNPRVYSLTKIVEISHYNMTRIRLVWSRIWAVLSDYFIHVGCLPNHMVASYAVDSLRQLAMKFLERDELANYTFQNDFLKPFVVVMRKSRRVEIRELIIRCVSQMVLARVSNVKSGWKSMFMVFTTAASDDSRAVVQLAFETIEKIVREYFSYITDTEVTTFTDCVNCLIAFTNNRFNTDISLNAIAFLSFCALKLAEGELGDLEAAGRSEGDPSAEKSRAPTCFEDKDVHVYFWFPLLAGLGELTFDPRPEIRRSALECLFDMLRIHGGSFSERFWERVFESVLFPIFDAVRAEFTDITTFSGASGEADDEIDAWLYETCKECLQHVLDLFVQFYSSVGALLPRVLDLVAGFVRRPHLKLAGVGMAGLVSLLSSAGHLFSEATWGEVLAVVSALAEDTRPDLAGLVPAPGAGPAAAGTEAGADAGAGAGADAGAGAGVGAGRALDLSSGAGARRLAACKVHAAVQLLMVQAVGSLYSKHVRRLRATHVCALLDVLGGAAAFARAADGDEGLCARLVAAQRTAGVAGALALPDPPLLQLEGEAAHAFLSMLLHVRHMAAVSSEGAAMDRAVDAERRLAGLCTDVLREYVPEQEAMGAHVNGAAVGAEGGGPPAAAAGLAESLRVRSPLVVAVLRALGSFEEGAFRDHLDHSFPLLTRLISCEHSPPEVQRALSELFASRVGPILEKNVGPGPQAQAGLGKTTSLPAM